MRSGDFEYSINGNEITINRYYGSEQYLTILSSIEGKPVTIIGDNAFYTITSLRSVIIPDSVRYIGMNAFAYCSNLKPPTPVKASPVNGSPVTRA